MNVTITERDGIAVVALEGEVDLSHSQALRKALMELTFDRRNIVVDLSAVGYIDSSGIAALVEAYQGARRNDTRLILAAPTESVSRVLRLSRLDQVFTLADNATAALALFPPASKG